MNRKKQDGEKSSGGFIVLCCVCAKTRNNRGKWIAPKCLPAENSGIVYSHGICPNCLQNMYGNELWYNQYKINTAGSSSSRCGYAGGKKKMLIIDDNSTTRSFLTAEFEDEFTVEVAENGTEGVVLAMCWQPTVILLDINIPGMSGVDVVCRLESQLRTKDIPVIVITASEHDDAAQRQLRPHRNFRGFLNKMTPTEEIRKTVWRVFR